MPNWEPAADLGLWALSVPTVEQPQPRWGRSTAMVRRTWGQNNSLSLSPTYLSHTTTITLSRIKCERLYFYKESCSFVHWSSSLLLTIFPLIFVLCICMWLYNSMSKWVNMKKRIYILSKWFKIIMVGRLGVMVYQPLWVCYLMPNAVLYIYIWYLWFINIFLITFLN